MAFFIKNIDVRFSLLRNTLKPIEVFLKFEPLTPLARRRIFFTWLGIFNEVWELVFVIKYIQNFKTVCLRINFLLLCLHSKFYYYYKYWPICMKVFLYLQYSVGNEVCIDFSLEFEIFYVLFFSSIMNTFLTYISDRTKLFLKRLLIKILQYPYKLLFNTVLWIKKQNLV